VKGFSPYGIEAAGDAASPQHPALSGPAIIANIAEPAVFERRGPAFRAAISGQQSKMGRSR
jgi:hypothetical protein